MIYRPSDIAREPGERVQYSDGRVQQPFPRFIGTWRRVKRLYLGLKHCENGIGRVAGLDLGGQAMGGNVFLRPLFVLLQSVFEDGLEVRGRGNRRIVWILGHCVVEELV